MQYNDLLTLVQERANLGSRAEAGAITRATLETLAERVQGDSANNLASELPRELATLMQRQPGTTGEQFPVDEFTRRVAERANIESDQAIRQLRVVLEALRAAESEGAINHLWAELPGEYLSLFEENPNPTQPSNDGQDMAPEIAPADRRR